MDTTKTMDTTNTNQTTAAEGDAGAEVIEARLCELGRRVYGDRWGEAEAALLGTDDPVNALACVLSHKVVGDSGAFSPGQMWVAMTDVLRHTTPQTREGQILELAARLVAGAATRGPLGPHVATL